MARILKTIHNLRLRYLFGLSLIALLVTASFLTMQRVVSEQRNFSSVINLASHQASLVNRISYFANIIATTSDEEEYVTAKSQIGQAISKILISQQALLEGDEEKNIPRVSNDTLERLYNDPNLGIVTMLNTFLNYAVIASNSKFEQFNKDSIAHIYLTTYGPHVLEPILDTAVQEYEHIGKSAILKIERMELGIWIAALVTLMIELFFIFIPLERRIRKALQSRDLSIADLTATRNRLISAQNLANVGDWEFIPVRSEMNWSTQVYDICGVEEKKFSVTVKSAIRLIHPEDRKDVVSAVREVLRTKNSSKIEYRIILPDHTERQVQQYAIYRKSQDGIHNAVIGTVQDITERKQYEERIRKLALYDSLTGLANRRLLRDRLTQTISLSRRNNNFGAVVMIDLDNFKAINDTRGHDVGDELLVEVAQRLTLCTRETDTIARLGGDEFVIILTFLGNTEDPALNNIDQIVTRIRAELGRPYYLANGTLIHQASASIGVAMFHNSELQENELLKRADVAMYEAKELGKDRICFYSRKRQEKIDLQNKIAEDLKSALTNNELELFLQPQVSQSGQVCGAEALLRWMPPGRPAVPPGIFIPVAESTGLILPIGEWVLQEACRHLRQIMTYSPSEEFRLAVNISAFQIDDPGFKEKVISTIEESGIPYSRLKFELTESSLIRNPGHGVAILSEFRDLGIQIELDDFGTGYSSLSSINRLPLDTLKIDGSLVQGIYKEESADNIIRTIIAMAKALHLEVIAEGVESVTQKHFLIEENIDLMQGYLFSEPLSFDNFIGQLSQYYNAGDTKPFLSPAVHDHVTNLLVHKGQGDGLQACIQ